MRLSPLLLVAALLASVAVAGACATQANVPWGTGTASPSGTRTPTGTPTFTGTVTGVPPTPIPPNLTVTGTVSLEECSALISQDPSHPTMNVRGGYLFKPGDEVLAWQVQDQVGGAALTTAGLANAGLFDVLHVASTDTSSEAEELLVFNPPPINSYHVRSGGDVHPNAQVCLVLPFTNLTVGASGPGLMAATAWNGSAGGIIAIHVWGELDLESNGTITARGMGLRGGVMNSSLQGCQGTPASGDGEGLDNATFGGLGPPAANFGGGGGGPELSGGGGGGNGGSGGNGGDGFGSVGTGMTSSCSNDGGAGGSYSLSFSSNDRIFLGGGGGAGSSRPAIHQPGASGGGVVFLLIEPTAALKGTGVIDASGGAVGNLTLPTSSYFGGAGGGAGGTVWAYVASTDLVLSPSFTTSASGGAGQSLILSPVPHPSSPEPGGGGGGGGGRVVTFGFLPGGAFAKPGPPGLVTGSGGIPVNGGVGQPGLPGSEVSNPLPPGKVP